MYKLLISIAVLCVSAYSSLSFANDWDIKRILVLHSYEPSYQWTADFQKGIDSAFSQSQTEVKLSIEYLIQSVSTALSITNLLRTTYVRNMQVINLMA